MSSEDFTMSVLTSPLAAARHAAYAATVRCTQLTGTIYANAMRTLTPPHGDGATLQNTRTKKSKGITKLRERIAEDIMGGPTPTFARPVQRADGSWMAFSPSGGYTEGHGNFGLVVPTVKKFGKASVPMEDPARIIKAGYFRRRRGSMRRLRRQHDGPHFVTASALKALVKRKQSHAGFTISGWTPGARHFSTGGSVARGFFPELGGRGAAGASEDLDKAWDNCEWTDWNAVVETGVDGWMSNESFHDTKQLRRIDFRTVSPLVGNALAKMKKNIVAWYSKKAREILS
jgi:hypothetical protein